MYSTNPRIAKILERNNCPLPPQEPVYDLESWRGPASRVDPERVWEDIQRRESPMIPQNRQGVSGYGTDWERQVTREGGLNQLPHLTPPVGSVAHISLQPEPRHVPRRAQLRTVQPRSNGDLQGRVGDSRSSGDLTDGSDSGLEPNGSGHRKDSEEVYKLGSPQSQPLRSDRYRNFLATASIMSLAHSVDLPPLQPSFISDDSFDLPDGSTSLASRASSRSSDLSSASQPSPFSTLKLASPPSSLHRQHQPAPRKEQPHFDSNIPTAPFPSPALRSPVPPPFPKSVSFQQPVTPLNRESAVSTNLPIVSFPKLQILPQMASTLPIISFQPASTVSPLPPPLPPTPSLVIPNSSNPRVQPSYVPVQEVTHPPFASQSSSSSEERRKSEGETKHTAISLRKHPPLERSTSHAHCQAEACNGASERGRSYCLRHLWMQFTPQGSETGKPWKIALEILSSELTYLQGLRCILKQFQKPAEASYAVKGPVSLPPWFQADLSIIFSNVGGLCMVSEELTTDLQLLRANRMLLRQVGATLLHFVPKFTPYCEYVCNFEKATQKLNSARRTSEAVNSWLNWTETSAGSSLESLLITPVQRLPRYLLLLDELRKSIRAAKMKERRKKHEIESENRDELEDVGDKELDCMDRAHSEISALTMRVNFTLRQLQLKELDTRFERDQRFEGLNGLYRDDRYLIKTGDLKLRMRRQTATYSKQKTFTFFLLTDILLCASSSNRSGFKLRHWMTLTGARIVREQDEITDGEWIMQGVDDSGYSDWLLTSANKQENEAWITALEEAVGGITEQSVVEMSRRDSTSLSVASMLDGLDEDVEVEEDGAFSSRAARQRSKDHRHRRVRWNPDQVSGIQSSPSV